MVTGPTTMVDHTTTLDHTTTHTTPQPWSTTPNHPRPWTRVVDCFLSEIFTRRPSLAFLSPRENPRLPLHRTTPPTCGDAGGRCGGAAHFLCRLRYLRMLSFRACAVYLGSWSHTQLPLTRRIPLCPRDLPQYGQDVDWSGIFMTPVGSSPVLSGLRLVCGFPRCAALIPVSGCCHLLGCRFAVRSRSCLAGGLA